MSDSVKTIVTVAGPNMGHILDTYALPSFERYGEKFGFDVTVERLPEDDADFYSQKARAARWHKLGAMRRALEKSDVIAWFDADVMIFRHDEDLADYVQPGATKANFQALALENIPLDRRYNPNTGVWIMRHCAQSFDFFDAMEAIGAPTKGGWMDQAVAMQALGWHMGDIDNWYYGAGPGLGNQFTLDTAWLPVGWNQPYVQRATNAESAVDRPTTENPHAIHYMGMSNEERDVVMGSMYHLIAK